MQSISQDISELIKENHTTEKMIFIGISSQPVRIPTSIGLQVKKRNIHFVRKHSDNSDLWVGRLYKNHRWLNVQKCVGDNVWECVDYTRDKLGIK